MPLEGYRAIVPRHHAPLVSVVAIIVVATACTSADAERYECPKAIQVATAGYSGKKMQPALDRLLSCDAAGADAAARALLSMRAERDTAVLGSLTFPLLGWRDPALLRAGQQLAEDSSATPESRVFALRGLHSQVFPGERPGYADMALNTANLCSGGHYVSEGLNETRPVDSSYVDEVRELGRRLASDAAEPRVVRRAATCLELIPKWWRAPKYDPTFRTP